MEAKELQIGDLVQNTCGHKGRVIGFRYYTEDKSNEIVISYKGNDTTWSSPSLIEPIPLTEDILKANGFDKNGFFSMKKIDTGSIKSEPLTIQLGKLFDTASVYWRCGGISQDVHISPSRLKYVHQLQHALRLCGLGELADNFKIEAS